MSRSGLRSVAEFPKMIHQAVDVLTDASEEINNVRRRTDFLAEEDVDDDFELSAGNVKQLAEEATMEMEKEDDIDDKAFPAESADSNAGSYKMTDVKSTRILTLPPKRRKT